MTDIKGEENRSNYIRQISKYPNMLSKYCDILLITKDFFFFFELRNYEMFHSANGIKREIQSFSTVVLSRYLPFRYHNILLSSSWYWTADGFSLFSFKTHYILCIYFLHKPNPFSAMFRVTLKEYGCPSSSLLSGQNRGKRIKEVQANISIVDIGTDKTTK